MKQEKKHASATEIELRVNHILELILKGYTRKDILRNVSKKYKVSDRQVEYYMAAASKDIKQLYGDDYKKDILEHHLAQLNDLYQKNYQNQNFRECRNLIESKNKMLGIGITKVDVTTKGEALSYRPIFGEIDPMLYEDTENNSVE